MAPDTAIALDLLQAFNIAVLRREGPFQYSCFGTMPFFYQKFFPPEQHGPCTRPWEYSPMLEHFWDDAEQFFADHDAGMFSSGVWQEDGLTEENAALMAIAMIIGETKFVIIRLLEEDYIERVGILRKAREQLIENQSLSQHLAFFKEKSRIDGLTQILNRATFMDILQEELMKSRSINIPVALIIMDIDDFKIINDTYGHLVGDKVLQALGILLMQKLRRDDIVARYGGEEFVVLIPRGSRRQVYRIGEKLRKAIASPSSPIHPPITVSVGCTVYRPNESIETFMERADAALYDAKKSGKNIVRVR